VTQKMHPDWERRFDSLPVRNPAPPAALSEFGWHGWEDETELGNEDDREGVQFLTLTQDGEEIAVIIHRLMDDDRDGPIKAQKEAMAQRIVDALNGQKGVRA